MTTHTLQSLLEWMGDPDTNVMWGWDAIVALARGPLNRTLAHDYLSRQGTDRQWPAFSGEIMTVEGLFKQVIHNVVLDAPDLSFVGTAINGQRARLHVPVIGGVQLGLRKVVDAWQVVSVAEFDRFQGPGLTLDLHLDQLSGSAGQLHVSLDFQHSDNWQLDFAPTANEQARGGAFFQAQFERLTPVQRRFTLALITPGDSEQLRPQSFRVRAQSREAQPAEHDADGALLVFVCMAGHPEGGSVDSSFRYLIPDDEAVDYSATVVLSQHLTEASQPGTLLAACATLIGSTDFACTYDATGALQSAVAQAGVLTVEPRPATWPTFAFNSEPLTVTLDSPALTFAASSSEPLTINYLADGRVTIEWTAEQQVSSTLHFSSPGGSVFPSLVTHDRCNLHLLASYVPATADAQFITSDNFRVFVSTQARPAPEQATFDFESDMARWAWQAFAAYVGTYLVQLFQPVIDSSVSSHLQHDFKFHTSLASQATDILTLDSGQVLRAETIAVPRDLAAFASIDPVPGAFAHDVVPPALEGLTVNPLIQVCDPGEQVELRAGLSGEGRLEWSILNPGAGHGSLTPHDGTGHGCTYQASEPPLTGQIYVLDEVQATDPVTGASRSVHVLVVQDTPRLNISVVADAGMPDGQIQLQALMTGMPPQGVQWRLPLGGPGTLDPASGLYTADSGATQRFVLVLAKVEIEGVNLLIEGHLLLPLPLADFPLY